MTGIFAFVLKIVGITADVLTISETLRNKLKASYSFEKVLAKSLNSAYQEEKDKIKDFSPTQFVKFDEKLATDKLLNLDKINIDNNDELINMLIPILSDVIYLDSFEDKNDIRFQEIVKLIAKKSIDKFWILINNYDSLVNEILIENTIETKDGIKDILAIQSEQGDAIVEIKQLLGKISSLSADIGLPTFDADNETATPKSQSFNEDCFINPFALVRAEDFNHNYSKLANLFQSFTEWSSVQSRTNNVFIIGGRGTGKSMILRRMSIQTIISDYHNNNQKAIQLADIKEDYYGIYIKLIRGKFDQYDNNNAIPLNQSNYLAQHELNISILDAFRDSILWLKQKSAIYFHESDLKSLISDLAHLFSESITCETFDDLDNLIKKEQKAIHQYYRNKAFELDGKYDGNATECGHFLTELSKIFRKYFYFNKKEFRLILLIDEYEALAEIQQKAINNIIKNRLPDLTIKLAMRKDSMKTRDTFTSGEPIQEPRDFSTFNIDYESSDNSKYNELLKGICSKRLADSAYNETNIEKYLIDSPNSDLYDEQKISDELNILWASGKRKSDYPNQEFFIKYRNTAIHRVYNKKNSNYPYYGFEQYKFLSNGIISNFLELCKYTFYFALTKEQNLHKNSAINLKIQSHSVYYVSKKLFNQIDGNVPEVGPILKRFLTDLSTIVRTKMLKHPSETECNKIAMLNYNEYRYRYKMLPKVIQKANTWSVLDYHTADETAETKNDTTAKTDEIIINRIYCPHLAMPPRSRWPVRISVDDLEGMLSDKPAKAFKKIINQMLPSDKNSSNVDSNDLFTNDTSRN